MLHPEYVFAFTIREHALEHWHFSPEDAAWHQRNMIEVAFELAKRADREKGLEIIIEGLTSD